MRVLYFLGLMLCGLQIHAQSLDEPPKLTRLHERVLKEEKVESIEAQLARAKKTKSKARGLKGGKRDVALRRAALAYAAVGVHWPNGDVFCRLEAAFREGETWRSLGDAALARGAFVEVTSVGFEAPSGLRDQESREFAVWVARAWLEQGHLSRRVLRFAHALRCYKKALSVEALPVRQQNDAREWLGKVHLKLANWEQAAHFFSRWAGESETAAEEIRAVDLEAEAWLRAGRVIHAKARLAELRLKWKNVSQDTGKVGEATRKAFARMKSPRLVEEIELVQAQSQASVLAKP